MMTMGDPFNDYLSKNYTNEPTKPDLRKFKDGTQACSVFPDGRKMKKCLYYWRNGVTKKCFFLGGNYRNPDNTCICYDVR